LKNKMKIVDKIKGFIRKRKKEVVNFTLDNCLSFILGQVDVKKTGIKRLEQSIESIKSKISVVKKEVNSIKASLKTAMDKI